MRFGIFDHMERRGDPLGELYEERLQLLERADEAGFWGYHKAEHHFIDLDAAPSSNVFLAAASQRTGRIRFGPLVYLLPFYHPLRLLEEICALDHLCGGRLEIGVGKGISPPEHRLWGLEPEEARAQFEDALAVLRQGLTRSAIDHEGPHYRYRDVPVVMQPVDGRVPGFWYAGNAEYAAAHRMSTVLSGPLDALAGAAERYRERLREPVADWNPGVEAPVFAVKRHVLVAATDEAAHERAARAYPVFHRNLAHLWKRFREPFPNRDPSFGGDMHAAIAAEDLLIGSPATVTARLRAIGERVGADYVILAFAWGDLGHREALASLDRFVAEVAPALG